MKHPNKGDYLFQFCALNVDFCLLSDFFFSANEIRGLTVNELQDAFQGNFGNVRQ